MNKITADEITVALDKEQSDYDPVFNKWFGEGKANEELKNLAVGLDQNPLFEIAYPSEIFFAGFVAALYILENRN